MPTLPPVDPGPAAAPESTGRDVQLEAATLHPGLSAPEPADASDTAGRGPRRSVRIALVATVIGAAAAGVAVWLLGTNGDEPAATAPASASDGTDTIGQVGVDAMNGAAEVVGEINADHGEAEVLAELGLDPSGEPMLDAPADVGHQFTWSFPDGRAATVVVDTTTGDHSYTDTAGVAFRQVGELAFVQPTSDAPWAMVDANDVVSIDRIGLERPIVVADLVDGPVAAHATASGDGSLWSIDDVAFAAADPAARADWLTRLGLSAGPADGSVTIWISTAGDDTVVSAATFERASTGEVARYDLDRRFDEPPVIESPDL